VRLLPPLGYAAPQRDPIMDIRSSFAGSKPQGQRQHEIMVQRLMYAQIAGIMSGKVFICTLLLPLLNVTALMIKPSAARERSSRPQLRPD
jgi:hypothetical protein